MHLEVRGADAFGKADVCHHPAMFGMCQWALPGLAKAEWSSGLRAFCIRLFQVF